MNTIYIVIDSEDASPVVLTGKVRLANSDTGTLMRSPWPIVHLTLTRQQATELVRQLQGADHGH